jgi:hypothetical protein
MKRLYAGRLAPVKGFYGAGFAFVVSDKATVRHPKRCHALETQFLRTTRKSDGVVAVYIYMGAVGVNSLSFKVFKPGTAYGVKCSVQAVFPK